jgi:hypothetical protein
VGVTGASVMSMAHIKNAGHAGQAPVLRKKNY